MSMPTHGTETKLPISYRAMSPLVVLLLAGLLVASAFALDSSAESSSYSDLMARALQGTWHAAPEADPAILPDGYQESDFLYVDGKYYLFATGSQDPAWVDVYVGNTIEELVHIPPRFTHVAPVRYPTVVKDGDTWHLWGVSLPSGWTKHYISHDAEPDVFVYSDTPFSERQSVASNYLSVVDFDVLKNPANAYWYGVGFEAWKSSPLLLTRATSPYGPWEKLNYTPKSLKGGVFDTNGPPSWAKGSRPDPTIAFTPNGRAWVFFSGWPNLPPAKGDVVKEGMVEVDVDTGIALGETIALFDPQTNAGLPFTGVSELNLISVYGEPDRILARDNNMSYPLAVLELPDYAVPPTGLTNVSTTDGAFSPPRGRAVIHTPALDIREHLYYC